jgi:Ca-activated chloride channel family protein
MDFGIHWIRPQAFWLLLLLIPIAWYARQLSDSKGQWTTVVDAHLLPYLLIDTQQGSSWSRTIFSVLGWIIFVMALAGPAWHQVPTPVFKKEQALVIILDASPMMLAEDIKPSRMVRAKYKLIDLLKSRREGQTALLAFSDEPYVVAPLTQDSQTLINFLPALSPEIMPAPGQRVDLALSQAAQLIKHTSSKGGEILLVTGGFSDKEALENQLRELKSQNIITSIYALGTPAGSPIPLHSGGFLKDSQDNIVMAHLNIPRLQVLAEAGGGKLVQMTMNNNDIKALNAILEPELRWQDNDKESELYLSLWQDEGHWFVLLLLPILLVGFFRRSRNEISL